VNSLLRDTTGKRSSKRVITMSASAMILAAFAADAFTDLSIDHSLLGAVQTIALVGLGAVTAEHFSPVAQRLKRKPDHEQNHGP
jgi:hypothetical protein